MNQLLPTVPYDPRDDLPNDVVDRAFPLDQCDHVSQVYVMLTGNGPHNYGHVPNVHNLYLGGADAAS